MPKFRKKPVEMTREKRLELAQKYTQEAVKKGLLDSEGAKEAIAWLTKDNGDYPPIRNTWTR